MKKILVFAVLLASFQVSFSQKTQIPAKPKLVVGIVIDQMRYDFLYRYYDSYSEKGFKRLLKEGFNCKNNHYHYATTYTGPGHAAIYTGSIPAINGIVGNEWYELSGKLTYVVEDSLVQSIGTNGTAGKMSPRNMLTTTITDQLRFATQFRSKVIGVAIKDRGAILPAGHTANAAYWYESQTGNWISSTYYMQDLPEWVKKFNQSGRAKQLLQIWQLAQSSYKNAEEDLQTYERALEGEKSAVFPHQINSFSLLASSPWGNTLTKEFALEAIRNEKLGKGSETDFLCISFSSTDIAGHSFGPFSVENQDMYVRLDQEIGDILAFLDKEFGKDNYLLFLTADHGVADVAGFSQKNKIPAGSASGSNHLQILQVAIEKKFGQGKWILYTENQQLYLNHSLLEQKKVSVKEIYEVVRKTLLRQPEVYSVVNLWDNEIEQSLPDYYASMVKNMYHPKRCGEIMILLKPAWYYGFSKGGTTHGTFYNYDTHVPLLWFGWKTPIGETSKRTHIADIAPTIATMLNLLEPNGCIGNPIEEMLKNLK